MISISGAINVNIDNKDVHGVFKLEFPSSIEECIHDDGSVGRRVGANSSTDWYNICISLEPFLSIPRRILTSN